METASKCTHHNGNRWPRIARTGTLAYSQAVHVLFICVDYGWMDGCCCTSMPRCLDAADCRVILFSLNTLALKHIQTHTHTFYYQWQHDNGQLTVQKSGGALAADAD